MRYVREGTSRLATTVLWRCLPTTYSEMFAFNAAVMGFEGLKWMKEVFDSSHTIVTNVSNSVLFARGVCHLRRLTTSPACWRPCEPSSPRTGAPTTFFQRARPPTPTQAQKRGPSTHTHEHAPPKHTRTHFQNTDRHEHAPSTHTKHCTVSYLNSQSVSSHACRSGLASRAAPVWWSWSLVLHFLLDLVLFLLLLCWVVVEVRMLMSHP